MNPLKFPMNFILGMNKIYIQIIGHGREIEIYRIWHTIMLVPSLLRLIVATIDYKKLLEECYHQLWSKSLKFNHFPHPICSFYPNKNHRFDAWGSMYLIFGANSTSISQKFWDKIYMFRNYEKIILNENVVIFFPLIYESYTTTKLPSIPPPLLDLGRYTLPTMLIPAEQYRFSVGFTNIPTDLDFRQFLVVPLH